MRCGTCGAVLPDFTNALWWESICPARLRFEFSGITTGALAEGGILSFMVRVSYSCGCGDKYYPQPVFRQAA